MKYLQQLFCLRHKDRYLWPDTNSTVLALVTPDSLSVLEFDNDCGHVVPAEPLGLLEVRRAALVKQLFNHSCQSSKLLSLLLDILRGCGFIGLWLQENARVGLPGWILLFRVRRVLLLVSDELYCFLASLALPDAVTGKDDKVEIICDFMGRHVRFGNDGSLIEL